MRTIESIGNLEVINPTTFKDAEAFCKLIGATLDVDVWSQYTSRTCFLLPKHKNAITYADRNDCIARGWTITDAKEFIAPTGEAGEDIDNEIAIHALIADVFNRRGTKSISEIVKELSPIYKVTLQRK